MPGNTDAIGAWRMKTTVDILETALERMGLTIWPRMQAPAMHYTVDDKSVIIVAQAHVLGSDESLGAFVRRVVVNQRNAAVYKMDTLDGKTFARLALW